MQSRELRKELELKKLLNSFGDDGEEVAVPNAKNARLQSLANDKNKPVYTLDNAKKLL